MLRPLRKIGKSKNRKIGDEPSLHYLAVEAQPEGLALARKVAGVVREGHHKLAGAADQDNITILLVGTGESFFAVEVSHRLNGSASFRFRLRFF